MTATPTRGTVKTHRAAGIDFSKPVLVFGSERKGPAAEPIRCDEVVIDRRGVAFMVDGKIVRGCGVATRFWVMQAPAAVEPVAAPAAPAAASDDLDSMKFAQLMELAKLHNVPGRGTARIAALREGVRAARAEAELAYASVFVSA